MQQQLWIEYHQPPVKTPYLDEYTDDLTAEAKADPDRFKAIGREQEIAQVVYNLTRRTKNNPILVGEAGVGKTAIVEGLARLIALKQAGDRLNHKKIKVLQIAALGQQDPVMKMLKIIDELKLTKGENILFIDEVHTIMGVDQGGGAMDLGDVLKPAMARGDIQLIGSTTLDEYDKFIERDPALQRRFQQVMVNEPTQMTALTILKGIQSRYEQFHQVKYSDEAIQACVTLSVRYIADRYLPDKAIDLMDQAGAIAEAKQQHEIGLVQVAEVLQEMRGIPVTNILKNDSSRLKNVRSKLGKVVKGQAEAISEVTNAITVAKAGLQSPDRPLCSFLFLGTSGTGKTALTRALAKVMFDSEDAMIRMDMSEFSERDSIEHFQDLVTGKIRALQESAALFSFLQANGIQSMQQLHEKIADMNSRYYDLRGKIVKAERRIAILTERGEMWEQYNQYKSIHKQLAKVKPEKREQFEQRHSRELILYDAAARYLKELKDSGEEITPKKWRREIDLLAAQKQVDSIDMKAMREELKAVERLRKTAEQLARQERDKPRDRGPER